MKKIFLTILSFVGVALTINAGDLPALNLSSLDKLYVKTDSNFITDGYVSNVGGQPINSLEYSYTVDGEDAGNGEITFTDPILPDPGKKVRVSFEFNGISSYKEHTVEVTIDKVNGEENMSSNPTATFTPYVVPFVPVHRPLVEEFTGLWCQWCPRGYVAMEEVGAHFRDMAVVACYHNGDAMTVTYTYPIEVSGLPKASIDRIAPIDPYGGGYGSEMDPVPGIFKAINNRIEEIPIASIDVTNVETGDFGIKFDIETIFCIEPTSSTYEVGYLLTANGLTNPNWIQNNAYSGRAGYEGTPMEMFTKLGYYVYDLVFNDVVVNVDAMKGIPGSLPSIEIGEKYVHNITIPKSGIHVTDDLESLVVNAFVIDKTTGRIVNANKTAVKEDDQPENPGEGDEEDQPENPGGGDENDQPENPGGGDEIDQPENPGSGDEDDQPENPGEDEDPGEEDEPTTSIEEVNTGLLIEKEYFDISGRKINTPAHGFYIVKTQMEDGSIKTEKIVIR